MKRCARLMLVLLVVLLVGKCGDDGGPKPNGGDEAWKEFAQDHYSTERFNAYVLGPIVEHSGVEDFNFGGICDEDSASYDEAACWKKIREVFPLSEEGSRAFYQQIDEEDRYVFGWDDWDSSIDELLWRAWDPLTDLPEGVPRTTPNRQRYQDMRD